MRLHLYFHLYMKDLVFLFLEAFSCGCPVILCNKSSFPEIAGDAALYFNPESIENLKNVIEEILDNPHLTFSLINKGFQRIKNFSWEKTAEKTIAVYNRVLNKQIERKKT